MEQTLFKVAVLLVAFFLTWILSRIFKLKLTGPQFIFIALPIWLVLMFVWLFWPILVK